MKYLSFCIAMMLLYTAVNATQFYSQGSLAPGNLSSWNSIAVGGGSSPVSFIEPGDIFTIQNGHTMVTTGTWTIGVSDSRLEIADGGALQGNHAIILAGTFAILNGGSYIHNNNAVAGIFGGNETFSTYSTVTIKNWENNTTTLPALTDWGNLIIDYTADLGGDWNQGGNLENIKGSFTIDHTGPAKFLLSDNEGLLLNIGGNLNISGGTLQVCNTSTAIAKAQLQVELDVNVSGGSLDLGDVDIAPNNELRFRGNLVASGGSISSTSENNCFLVANGNTLQSINTVVTVNASIRTISTSSVQLLSDIIMGQFKNLVISGAFTTGVNDINSNGYGQLIIAGGTLTSGGVINMQNSSCIVCSGQGNFTPTSDYLWCESSGSAGELTMQNSHMLFSKTAAARLLAGVENSTGSVVLTNSNISFSEPGSGSGAVELAADGRFIFDEFSVIEGAAYFRANGGSLVTANASGFELTGTNGSITVTGSRVYNNASFINNFEYNGTGLQSTGNGLPSSINGSLTINNSSGEQSAVTLINPVTIESGGSLNLTNGILINDLSSIITILAGSVVNGGSAQSFVTGPMVKYGNTNFTFPIGKGTRYAPLMLNSTGNVTEDAPGDIFRAEYISGDPKVLIGSDLGPLLNRISSLEYWNLVQVAGSSVKRTGFSYGSQSGVQNPASLAVAFYDGDQWLNAGADIGMQPNRIVADLFSFGSFTLGSSDASNTLPVKLRSFTAKREKEDVLLQWSISGEQDATYFEVLSSVDNERYFSIGKVVAAAGAVNYSFSDRSPKSRTVYYRLRITEKDGRSWLSGIVSLNYASKALQLMWVSPSLTAGATRIGISSSINTNLQLVITNGEGRIVKRFSHAVAEGYSSLMVNTGALAAGVYYITAYDDRKRSNSIRVSKK